MQKNNYITVIIPAYNEEENIGSVIDEIKTNPNLDEIIVVDNNSTDSTSDIAKEHGAKVIYCENKGKGYAIEKGIKEATHEIVVFLDADVKNYEQDIVNMLSEPIIKEEADFVKSTFNRKEGGSVTQIATKPLLNILFPDMYKFSEPLSGMIAGKKSMLENLEFEKDYGVDIGILLDVIKMGARVKEVNIGAIDNLSHINKTTERMQNMSTEVMKAILKRGKFNI